MENTAPEAKTFWQLLRFFQQEIHGPKKLVILISWFSGVAHGLLLVILNQAIDKTAGNSSQSPLVLLGAFVICLVFLVAGTYANMIRVSHLVGEMAHHLRTDLANRLLRAPLRFIEGWQHNELFSYFTSDINLITHAAMTLVQVLRDVTLLVFCLIYIGWISPQALAITLSLIFLAILIHFATYGRAKDSLHQECLSREQFYIAIGDMIDGFKELKLHRLRSLDLWEHSHRYSKDNLVLFIQTRLLFFISVLFSKLFLFVVLGIMAFIPETWLDATASQHFKLLAVLLFAMGPLESIIDSMSSFTGGLVGLEKVVYLKNRLRALESVSPTQTDQSDTTTLEGPIVFRQALMQYHDQKTGEYFTVGPFDLAIQPGEILFIVGGNGSGKTTLIKLIAGLYQYQQGSLHIHNQSVEELGWEAYRSLFSTVLSDFHLFPKLYGMGNLESAQVTEYLARFGLQQKTSFEGSHFSTRDLSSGQRKRLALIVALMEKRPVLLFDEFSADQDPQFRRFFYRELLPELKRAGKTIIAVTHDDAYFDCCDRLIQMNYGMVAT